MVIAVAHPPVDCNVLESKLIWNLFETNLRSVERTFGCIVIDNPTVANSVRYLVWDKVGKKWYHRLSGGGMFPLHTNTLRRELLMFKSKGYRIRGDAGLYLTIGRGARRVPGIQKNKSIVEL